MPANLVAVERGADYVRAMPPEELILGTALRWAPSLNAMLKHRPAADVEDSRSRLQVDRVGSESD
jgi:hypothetical protein